MRDIFWSCCLRYALTQTYLAVQVVLYFLLCFFFFLFLKISSKYHTSSSTKQIAVAFD